MASSNIRIGGGKLYISPFVPGTQFPAGYVYVGNAPAFSVTVENQLYDHYSSTTGVKQKDISIVTQTNYTGNTTLDELSKENQAMFFSGVASVITYSAATVTEELYTNAAKKGGYYKLGVSTSNPTGVVHLDVHTAPSTKIIAVFGTSTAMVEGTDYTIDMAKGILYILPTSTVVTDGGTFKVSYKVKAHKKNTVGSGTTPFQGAAMFVSDNAGAAANENLNEDYYLPSIQLSANGEFQLINNNEAGSLAMRLDVYIPEDGRPAISSSTRGVLTA